MSQTADTLSRSTSDEGSRTSSHGDFIWYELMTTDPDGAKTFYDAVVGWNIASHADPGAGGADYRMIERADSKQSADAGNAGGVLALTDEMVKGGARPCWLGYLAVDDVDKATDAIVAAGGKLQMPAIDLPVGRFAMVTDPQGAPFYVMKPTPPPGKKGLGSDVFSPDQPGRVSWNELSTSDPAAARKFYGDQFGWVSDDFMDMGEMGEYRFIDHHGVRLGALSGTFHGQPPSWRYYIRVPSIAAAKAIAEQKGGTINMGPMQVPGGDYIIIGADPQGAEFALVGAE